MPRIPQPFRKTEGTNPPPPGKISIEMPHFECPAMPNISMADRQPSNLARYSPYDSPDPRDI